MKAYSGPAGADSTFKTIVADTWLKTGSFGVHMPVYSDIENIQGNTFGEKDLLDFEFIGTDSLKAIEGREVRLPGVKSLWERARVDSIFVKGDPGNEREKYYMEYFALYLDCSQWMKTKLKVSSPQMFELLMDGDKILSKDGFDKKGADEVGYKSKDLELTTGRHFFLLKSLYRASDSLDWKAGLSLQYDSTKFTRGASFSIDPAGVMTITDLLDGTDVKSTSISPDGKYIALNYSKTGPPDGATERWTDILDFKGQLIRSFRHSEMSDFQWMPSDNRFSFVTSSDKGSTLWVSGMDEAGQTPVLENVKDFASYRWSPDGDFVIYSTTIKPENDNADLKRLQGMPDRWPWYRVRQFLFKLDYPALTSERLTSGLETTGLQDISPDGKKILFSIEYPDFSQRPYSRQLLILMDLRDYSLDTLWNSNYSGSASFSPDGKKLLVTAGPMMFGGIGKNVKGKRIPNDYDNQAYIFTIADGSVKPMTKDFDPSISNAYWSKVDGKIYLVVEDKRYKHLFRLDPEDDVFTQIPVSIEVISNISYADNAAVAAYYGTSQQVPPQAYSLELGPAKSILISDPRKEQYQNIVFGKTEDWTFKNKEGLTIDGSVFYPPNYDPDKKYPVIVNYYGGTVPIDRSFGGRYPRNIFVANGYILYVLEPGGATGYGQNFSALHVNNWGITVADDIIDGTKLFLKDHPSADPERVGCIGASYGGFMTMLLQTRTDIFACAIAHAGISDISSYWGAGYWGYLYSSVASTNSFPWNNKKLYVDQSPLYNANKIRTPLLLLHGTSDTNVPIGESLQLYTALKLLGRPVELVEIKAQNHHILDYKKRIEWNNTILAWFDRYLKSEPAWWNDLYPGEK